MSLIEEVLREFQAVQVVISSSWREHHPMDEMREYFAIDLQPRIIGATPLRYPASQVPAGLQDYVRQCECLTWTSAAATWHPLDRARRSGLAV
jgi:hypothetical protein